MFTTRFRWGVPAVFAGLVLAGTVRAQTPDRPPPPPGPPAGADRAQELTRGPIHEAWGRPLVFNPQPGPIAPKRPPELIQEVPPDEKPEGDTVAWIPGYWGWDDEAKTFIWVSGFWRSVPPGRAWVPGYWATLDTGYQWVSGYWAPNTIAEIEYLPPPPETLEAGPATEAPAENQVWIPGVWVWRETRYLWRPGFWTNANPDWVWVPAHYEWSPSGYVFVDGYWDYPLFNRGLLFTPVMFTAVPTAYTPSVVIDVRFLAGALFARPAYDHYYFGDYYADSYARAGIYPWFAFHNSRLGYDPLFAQSAFIYSRRDPQWTDQVRAVYFERREHADARPPHTYAQFRDWTRRVDPDGRNPVAFARPLADVQRTRDFPVRLERLDERRLQTIRTQATQVQKYRTERIRAETQAARELPRTGTNTDPKVPGHPARMAPARVKMPDAPRLTQTEPGVGGTAAPTAGRTSGRVTPPPDAPRVPDVAPPRTVPPTGPKTPARTLPHPEDNLRPPAGSRPKGPDREIVPPGRREVPEGPSRIAPPVNEPPRRSPPAAEPPRTPPSAKDAPPKGPPKKDKD